MKYVFPLVLVLTMMSCSSTSDSNNELPADLKGTYVGTLPCADCEGIQYEITLAEGDRFIDGMIYRGRSSNVINASGSFEVSEGIIKLEKPTEGFRFLTGHPEGLLMLDKNGEKITSSTADLYILKRQEKPVLSVSGPESGAESGAATPSNTTKNTGTAESEESKAAKMTRNIKKAGEGVDFHAYGTEPSWFLDITFDKGMVFESGSGLKIRTPMGSAADTDDPFDQKYRAETEAAVLIVEFMKGDCSDAMSGEQFEYSVSIQAKNTVDQDYQDFKGCGAYTIDPRLHNIWVIQEYNGEQLDYQKFTKGIPQLEINVREGIYMGHDGCNSIRGGMSVQMSSLTFSAGPTTLMACDDDGESTRITRDLVGGPFQFAFKKGFVELSRDGEVVFLLKNVD